jgi:hypothetical protein
MASRAVVFGLIVVFAWGVEASSVGATHPAGFHWPRTDNPFAVQIGDNSTGVWPALLAEVAAVWSQSVVLDVEVVSGQGQGVCQANLGRVEVCNGNFGNAGWLGLAEVWVDKKGHIVQATIKLNDPLFVPGTYNEFAKRHILCQEVGHVLGLGHLRDPTSESCMDETHGINDPAWAYPNAHDLEQLERIYRHRDTSAKADRPARSVALSQRAPSGGVRWSISVRDAGDETTVYAWAAWPVV